MNGSRLPVHVIHQQILAEVVRSSEVSLAATEFGDLLNEVDEAVIAGEHKGIDEDALLLAAVDLFQGLADDERIETEGVAIDAAIFESESRGFPVGDHDDLLHIFAFAGQKFLRHDEAVPGVGVVGAYLCTGKLADVELFCGIVEEHAAERIAGVLGLNEMLQRHGHLLGGSEAVLTIKDHAVTAIEKEDGGAGALVFALVYVQVRVFEIERDFGTFTANGGKEGLADIEIEGIAELVLARGTGGFDAGGHVASVVAAEAGFAEGAEEVFQSFEAEKVEGFVGDLELHFALRALAVAALLGFSGGDVARIDELLDEGIDELFHLLAGHGGELLHHLLDLFVGEESAFIEGAADGLFQVVERLLLPLAGGVVGIVEAALQQVVGESLEKIVGVDA